MANKAKIRFLSAITGILSIFSFAALPACGIFVNSDNNNNDNDDGDSVKSGTPHVSAQGIEDRYTRSSEKIVNFAKGESPEGDSSAFNRADGYGNGGMFNCKWSAGNAEISQGTMNMSVTKSGDGYLGAEYRSNDSYSYGFYSVSMKAIKCSGVVSSFFTYTRWPQWDEIDIEFLGKDTTKVQFNYFTGGVGGHEFLYDLGFDASAGFHEYAFDWQENSITWYVDGKAVYKVTTDIPSHAGKIMMNVWNGTGTDDWLGAFDDSKLPVTAQYGWIGYGGSSDSTETPTQPTTPTKPTTPTEPDVPSVPDKLTPDSDKIANFENGAANGFSKADGWSNGGMFNCTWRKNNVKFNNGTMDLTITQENGGYAGGEYRSDNRYSYGYFSVCMKPAKCPGTVSSFFTYTGPGDNSPWDEIDIEFLGKDTTKVQFNYYTNGEGNHEYLYDLGFDASQGYHEYGFDWQSDHITWYVDGKAVYTATKDIPSHAGKIMMNVWPGTGVDGWLDEFTPTSFPITAQYKWAGYKATN